MACPVCLWGPEIEGIWIVHVDDQNNREPWHDLAMGVTSLWRSPPYIFL